MDRKISHQPLSSWRPCHLPWWPLCELGVPGLAEPRFWPESPWAAPGSCKQVCVLLLRLPRVPHSHVLIKVASLIFCHRGSCWPGGTRDMLLGAAETWPVPPQPCWDHPTVWVVLSPGWHHISGLPSISEIPACSLGTTRVLASHTVLIISEDW